MALTVVVRQGFTMAIVKESLSDDPLKVAEDPPAKLLLLEIVMSF